MLRLTICVLLATNIGLLSADVCPSGDSRCTCRVQQSQISVFCLGLTSLPAILPHPNATKVELYGSEFFAIHKSNMTAFLNVTELTIGGSANNLLIDSDSFSQLSSLRYLNLSYNHGLHLGSTRGELTGPTSLTTLILQSNGFEHVPKLQSLTKLVNLSLDQNEGIHADMSSSLPSSLISLSLNGCLLKEIPTQLLRDVPNLGLLNLSRNSLHKLPENSFLSIPSVELIDLSHSQVESIHAHAFKDVVNLKYLVLSGNTIEELDSELFASFSRNLVYLNISNNNLEFLPDDLLANCTNLKTVLLGHNQWNCECRWTSSIDKNIVIDNSAFTCDEPKDAQGKNVFDVTTSLELCKDYDAEHQEGHSKIIIAVAVFVLIICALLICFGIYHIVQKRRDSATNRGSGATKKDVKYSEVYKDTTEQA